jgi:hypothetical protein
LVRELDAHAEGAFLSRTKFIELLIREALAARPPAGRKQRARPKA